jgi:hypothetical protein
VRQRLVGLVAIIAMEIAAAADFGRNIFCC